MISIDDLPRDSNGITQGVWRLVHADPTFAGGLGTVHMADGVSMTPVCGRALRAIVAEYGKHLFIEPWGELPSSFALPELVFATVSDEALDKLSRAPWRDVAAEACMSLTEELLKLGGDGAPADFARAMLEVPTLTGNDAISARALYIERAASLRVDGYVEIPKALEGAIEQLDGIIANEPPTAPPTEPIAPSDPIAPIDAIEAAPAPTDDGLPPVIAPPTEPIAPSDPIAPIDAIEAAPAPTDDGLPPVIAPPTEPIATEAPKPKKAKPQKP